MSTGIPLPPSSTETVLSELIDIASEVEDKNLKMNLKDSVSPVLIEDASDKNSYYVIMPMKI